MEKMMMDLAKSVKEMKNAVEGSKNTITDTPFIVTIDGMAITFSVAGPGKVKSPRKCPPHKAMRFSKQDAEMIAKTVQDGRGYHGKAVHWVEATNTLIAVYQDLFGKYSG